MPTSGEEPCRAARPSSESRGVTASHLAPAPTRTRRAAASMRTPVSRDVLTIIVPSSEPSGPALCPVAWAASRRPVVAGVAHDGGDLPLVGGQRDRLRPLVDEQVEGLAGRVPVGVAGQRRCTRGRRPGWGDRWSTCVAPGQGMCGGAQNRAQRPAHIEVDPNRRPEDLPGAGPPGIPMRTENSGARRPRGAGAARPGGVALIRGPIIGVDVRGYARCPMACGAHAHVTALSTANPLRRLVCCGQRGAAAGVRPPWQPVAQAVRIVACRCRCGLVPVLPSTSAVFGPRLVAQDGLPMTARAAQPYRHRPRRRRPHVTIAVELRVDDGVPPRQRRRPRTALRRSTCARIPRAGVAADCRGCRSRGGTGAGRPERHPSELPAPGARATRRRLTRLGPCGRPQPAAGRCAGRLA